MTSAGSPVAAWGSDGCDVAKNPWSSVVIPAPENSTTTVKGVAAPSVMIFVLGTRRAVLERGLEPGGRPPATS